METRAIGFLTNGFCNNTAIKVEIIIVHVDGSIWGINNPKEFASTSLEIDLSLAKVSQENRCLFV